MPNTEKPKKPRKRQLDNGATLYCIASNGKDSLNIFEKDNKLTFRTFTGGKPDFDTYTINIKNGKLNIFKKSRDSYGRAGKTIRNVTRKPNKFAEHINIYIKNSCYYTIKDFESDDSSVPF